MTSTADAAANASSASSTPASEKPESLMQTLQSLWRDLPGLVSDRVELLSLELKRAGLALVQLVMLIVGVAILGVTAWLVLWAVVVALLMLAGLHVGWALLIVLAINLLAIFSAVGRVRTLLPQLKLPATRRHLTLSPSPQPSSSERNDGHHDHRTDFPPASQPAAR